MSINIWYVKAWVWGPLASLFNYSYKYYRMYSIQTVCCPLSTFRANLSSGIHGNIDTFLTTENLPHSLWGCSQPTNHRKGVPVYTVDSITTDTCAVYICVGLGACFVPVLLCLVLLCYWWWGICGDSRRKEAKSHFPSYLCEQIIIIAEGKLANNQGGNGLLLWQSLLENHGAIWFKGQMHVLTVWVIASATLPIWVCPSDSILCYSSD